MDTSVLYLFLANRCQPIHLSKYSMISTVRNDFRPSSPLSELDLQGFTDALDKGAGDGVEPSQALAVSRL